ncbi:MAG: TonB-dependent receptor plug domain-containing protein, partial [Flavisolibacter sp.]
MCKNQRGTGKSTMLLFLFLPLLLISITSDAQLRTVSGTVSDSKTNVPLGDVSVTVKGSKAGTATDANGKFSIAASTSQVLVFTSVGYQPQEVPAGQESFSIKLVNINQQLSDVVVVGYGTRKKGSVTGSVANVDAKVFQDRGPVSSPLAALQGQVPGVTVTRNSAQPGRETWNFLVRGNSSVNGAEPLVIIDGLTLPSSTALNSMNPADIDNISFLKDAAASSIYGARAAGGVVIITTKRAKMGKSVIEYNGSVSRKIIGLQPQLTGISTWGPLMEEARQTDGFAATD